MPQIFVEYKKKGLSFESIYEEMIPIGTKFTFNGQEMEIVEHLLDSKGHPNCSHPYKVRKCQSGRFGIFMHCQIKRAIQEN